MGRLVKQGLVALAFVSAHVTPSFAQVEQRSFAAPALRVPSSAGSDGEAGAGTAGDMPQTAQVQGEVQVQAEPAAAPAPASASAESPVPSEAAKEVPASPAAPVRPVGASPKAAAPTKPTPQWPLTAADVAEKKKQKAGPAGAVANPATPPATWTEADLVIAKARCSTLLKDIEAVYVPMEPMREGDCGTPAPIQLMAVGKNPQVVVSPPAVVTCDLVATLHTWLQSDLQPSARRLLGSPIVKIENMSSYSCRNAYGRAKTRLSEHGRANALDIRGFLTASGHGPEVLADWGPTMRDIREQEVAAARAAAAKAAALKAEADRKSTETAGKAPSETAAIPGGIGTLIEGVPKVTGVLPSQESRHDPSAAFGPSQHLGGPKPADDHGPMSASQRPRPVPSSAPDYKKQQFLREAHTTACRRFATALGPEANNAHRNHLHVDMAERSTGAFCE